MRLAATMSLLYEIAAVECYFNLHARPESVCFIGSGLYNEGETKEKANEDFYGSRAQNDLRLMEGQYFNA